METVKIAPSPTSDEITITKDCIHTDFAGGITYKAEQMTTKYNHDYLRETFSMAIAFSSKRWQLEYLLNDFLKLEGKVE